jgi:hypothetical protein
MIPPVMSSVRYALSGVGGPWESIEPFLVRGGLRAGGFPDDVLWLELQLELRVELGIGVIDTGNWRICTG